MAMEVANGVVSKIESLERDNASKKDEIKKLKKEIDSLRRDGDATAARAAELESEAAAEMSAAEESRLEAETLQKVLEDREDAITFLERESNLLKQANAESEMKVRDLERKVSVYEVKLSEEWSKRVRVEEEMKEKIGDRDRDIELLKQRIEELVEMRSDYEEGESEEKKRLGLVWPVVAAGCGAVAAVFYFCFRKRK